MKRHEELIPLSHDHHQALLVALRLKKGGPASWRDAWPADAELQRSALFTFVDNELLPHFQLEEEILFPACRRSAESVSMLANDLAGEHAQMRAKLDDIKHSSASALKEKLADFGVILEAHVRKEERSFFPLVEEGMLNNTLTVDLELLAAKYAEYHRPTACDT